SPRRQPRRPTPDGQQPQLIRPTSMSLNDPQWGRRGGGGGGGGNQGPPDLDELWRNFNQRLAAIFGRRGGGAPGGEPPNFRQLGGGASLLVFLVLVVWLASGF